MSIFILDVPRVTDVARALRAACRHASNVR